MAFWFTTKDSRLIVPRFLVLVLMGAFIITPCWCGPIKTEGSNLPWWCQPCKQIHKTRHSRDLNDALETIFNIAITRYDNTISKYVSQLHNKLGIRNMTKKQLRKNNWLPKKKFFKTLKKNDEKILPELHRQIQIYAVTIEKLSSMKISTIDGSFNSDDRNTILNDVKSNLHQLICETEQEIFEKHMKTLGTVEPDYIDDKKIPAHTENIIDVYLKDYTVLKDYENFIVKCYTKIFGKVKRSKKGRKLGKNGKNKKRTNKKNLEKKVKS